MAYDSCGGPASVSAYPVGGRHRAVSPERVLAPDDLTRTLLAVTARALLPDGAADADRLPEPDPPAPGPGLPAPDPGRRPDVAGRGHVRPQLRGRPGVRSGVDPHAAGDIDAESVASWYVGHYPPRGRSPYPAVVIGSPHGAATHLAAAMGAPWLPSGFEFAVNWPEGSAAEPARALRHGVAVARRLISANPEIAVRQVHDPVLWGAAAGTTVRLFARWRRVPAAYREFLRTRLASGGTVLLVRDARAWPVFDLGAGMSYQLGSPAAGLEPEDYLCAGPDLRQALRLAGADPGRWYPPAATLPVEGFAEQGPEQGYEEDLRSLATAGGWQLSGVLYPRPATLSIPVAELIRGWLAASGRADDRLAVECGRLLDPAQTLRSGLVPYWCESSLRSEIADAEWWLAGSRRFRTIDVLVEPPGRPSSTVAPIPQWRAISWFATVRGTVDRTGLRCYPYGSLSARHAAVVLSGHPDDPPGLPRLGTDLAVRGLAEAGRRLGLLAY